MDRSPSLVFMWTCEASGPVGACATALLQTLEIASDTILSGKAKVVIAGASMTSDISEEGFYQLANMKATSNAETEFAMGLNQLKCLVQRQLLVLASWRLKEPPCILS